MILNNIVGIYARKESNMFLPAIAEKLNKQKEQPIEQRLQLPNYYEQYEEYNKKQEEKETKETVIHIQII